MSGPADAWWDDLRQEAELPPPPPRSAAPMVLGALAAVLASGGLAWWLTSSETQPYRNPEAVAVRPPPARVANPTADVEQVRRAYEEIGAVYAASGSEGLARFSESCAQSLKGDPRILDFCLAFDLFADSLRAEAGEVAGKAAARRLGYVQAALPPGADPDARIAEVRLQMRRVSGVPSVTSPESSGALAQLDSVSVPAAQPAPGAAASPAPAQRRPAGPVRLAKAEPARKASPYTACRQRPTPADRLICATPALAVEHQRMRAAYERAIAAGADPLVIDAGQAEWRAARNEASERRELAELYARRIRELEATAKAAPRREEPPREEPPI